MNRKTFDTIVDQQFLRCLDVLGIKDSEYAVEGDRLHNFKVAAGLKHETPRQALIGMMVKHTVSVYDMGLDTRTYYSDAIWDEKITDNINYLLLLKAILSEEKEEITLRKMQVKEEVENLGLKLKVKHGIIESTKPVIDWEKDDDD